MKSLETQLVEQEAELKRLRQIIEDHGITKAGTGKRTANTVDIVESYKGLGLSHQEAVKAAGLESAVVNLSKAQRRIVENARRMGLSDAAATLFALGRRAL